MTVKEQHFQCGWSDRHIISVDKYKEGKGLDLNYFFEIRTPGPVPTKEEVEKARLEAFKQEKTTHHVIITYLDSDTVPENSRNAPLDGRVLMTETDEWGFAKSPKKRVSLDGDTFYDWKPLTHSDEVKYRQKAYDLSKIEVKKPKKKSKW